MSLLGLGDHPSQVQVQDFRQQGREDDHGASGAPRAVLGLRL